MVDVGSSCDVVSSTWEPCTTEKALVVLSSFIEEREGDKAGGRRTALLDQNGEKRGDGNDGTSVERSVDVAQLHVVRHGIADLTRRGQIEGDTDFVKDEDARAKTVGELLKNVKRKRKKDKKEKKEKKECKKEKKKEKSKKAKK